MERRSGGGSDTNGQIVGFVPREAGAQLEKCSIEQVSLFQGRTGRKGSAPTLIQGLLPPSSRMWGRYLDGRSQRAGSQSSLCEVLATSLATASTLGSALTIAVRHGRVGNMAHIEAVAAAASTGMKQFNR